MATINDVPVPLVVDELLLVASATSPEDWANPNLPL
jgi:hypothetical protein